MSEEILASNKSAYRKHCIQFCFQDVVHSLTWATDRKSCYFDDIVLSAMKYVQNTTETVLR